VQRSSVIAPGGVLHHAVQVTKYAQRSRTSAPGPAGRTSWAGLHEVVALDVELARERNLARAGLLVFGVVDARRRVSTCPSGQFSMTTFSGVSTAMRRGARLVEVVAHGVLELGMSMTLSTLVTPMSSQKCAGCLGV
jgi:hypothetical protein